MNPDLNDADLLHVLGALEDYADRLRAGVRPDRAEFLARHPALASVLADGVDGLAWLDQAAAHFAAVLGSEPLAVGPDPEPVEAAALPATSGQPARSVRPSRPVVCAVTVLVALAGLGTGAALLRRPVGPGASPRPPASPTPSHDDSNPPRGATRVVQIVRELSEPMGD